MTKLTKNTKYDLKCLMFAYWLKTALLCSRKHTVKTTSWFQTFWQALSFKISTFDIFDK